MHFLYTFFYSSKFSQQSRVLGYECKAGRLFLVLLTSTLQKPAVIMACYGIARVEPYGS